MQGCGHGGQPRGDGRRAGADDAGGVWKSRGGGGRARQALAVAEGAGGTVVAQARPRDRLHGRRHQRRARPSRRRRGYFGRYSGRRGQGVRRHRAARKKPHGARRRHSRRTARLRQHHQIHQDGGKLELRQHVQRRRRELPVTLPADAADPDSA